MAPTQPPATCIKPSNPNGRMSTHDLPKLQTSSSALLQCAHAYYNAAAHPPTYSPTYSPPWTYHHSPHQPLDVHATEFQETRRLFRQLLAIKKRARAARSAGARGRGLYFKLYAQADDKREEMEETERRHDARRRLAWEMKKELNERMRVRYPRVKG